jgi:hypothetical protein
MPVSAVGRIHRVEILLLEERRSAPSHARDHRVQLAREELLLVADLLGAAPDLDVRAGVRQHRPDVDESVAGIGTAKRAQAVLRRQDLPVDHQAPDLAVLGALGNASRGGAHVIDDVLRDDVDVDLRADLGLGLLSLSLRGSAGDEQAGDQKGGVDSKHHGGVPPPYPYHGSRLKARPMVSIQQVCAP